MKYLTKEQIIYLHKQLIQEFGGIGGIRNENLLESAITSPFQTFSSKEFYPTIEEKAARLGYGLVSNHCFFDGNKRIGAHAMLVFLALNDIQLDFTQEELIQIFLDLASNNSDYNTLLIWIRSHERK